MHIIVRLFSVIVHVLGSTYLIANMITPNRIIKTKSLIYRYHNFNSHDQSNSYSQLNVMYYMIYTLSQLSSLQLYYITLVYIIKPCMLRPHATLANTKLINYYIILNLNFFYLDCSFMIHDNYSLTCKLSGKFLLQQFSSLSNMYSVVSIPKIPTSYTDEDLAVPVIDSLLLFSMVPNIHLLRKYSADFIESFNTSPCMGYICIITIAIQLLSSLQNQSEYLALLKFIASRL